MFECVGGNHTGITRHFLSYRYPLVPWYSIRDTLSRSSMENAIVHIYIYIYRCVKPHFSDAGIMLCGRRLSAISKRVTIGNRH